MPKPERTCSAWLLVGALLVGVTVGAPLGGRWMAHLMEPVVSELVGERDRLVEIVAEREQLAGRLDRIEAALSGTGCFIGRGGQ